MTNLRFDATIKQNLRQTTRLKFDRGDIPMEALHSAHSEPDAADPCVTIAIPTFNRAVWLRDCVAVALEQSYQNFEVLVSDNASTDETADVLAGFVHPKLRIVKQRENIGLIPNWNACLAAAKGDYVVFVSDDERIAPRMLERCVSLIRREPKIPIIIALCDVNFVADPVWRASVNKKLGTGIWDGAEILLEFLRDRMPAAMCSIMIRTERLRAEGGFPATFPFAGDMARCASILLTGNGGFINESCGTTWTHNANESSKVTLDIRLHGLRNMVDLISDMADSSIKNLQMRRTVKLEARRYFVRYAIRFIALYRRDGAKLTTVLPVIWQLRRDLSAIGVTNVFKLARPFSIILLPGRMTRGLRRSKRILRQLNPEVPRADATHKI